jgi:tripartite-type tricarboxylate transporter receptor subunit TctC
MTRSSPRAGALAFAMMVAALAPSAPARAEGYPSRPITIIVSLAAGTGMDTLVRIYGEQLSQPDG